MSYYNFERMSDGILLAGRLLLVLLFLISGWIKLSGFDDTITLMVKFGMPAPAVMAVVAILLKLPVALAILLGFATRPLALIFAGYAVMAAGRIRGCDRREARQPVHDAQPNPRGEAAPGGRLVSGDF